NAKCRAATLSARCERCSKEEDHKTGGRNGDLEHSLYTELIDIRARALHRRDKSPKFTESHIGWRIFRHGKVNRALHEVAIVQRVERDGEIRLVASKDMDGAARQSPSIALSICRSCR